MSKWHGGKGSSTRPRGVSSEQFESNWDKIFNKKKEVDMWTHRCPVEGLISIAKGETCSWCGAFEESK